MRLSTVDHVVSKLGPVNALVEKLCERLLPHEIARAAGSGCGGPTICDLDPSCDGRPGVALYCELDPGTFYFLHCGC